MNLVEMRHPPSENRYPPAAAAEDDWRLEFCSGEKTADLQYLWDDDDHCCLYSILNSTQMILLDFSNHLNKNFADNTYVTKCNPNEYRTSTDDAECTLVEFVRIGCVLQGNENCLASIPMGMEKGQNSLCSTHNSLMLILLAFLLSFSRFPPPLLSSLSQIPFP
ncbi:hypothetical protein LXL04_013491 [Taraxacum kok-saghyz]